VLLACEAPTFAAPATVQQFDSQTWLSVQRSRNRPQAVVFSTTDCSHCPAAISKIAAALDKSPSKPRLAVVVMDGQGQEFTLRTDKHYRVADALYVFDGDAVHLRYGVNPDWRGLTPYVVLLPTSGAPRYFNGVPPAEALRAFQQP
jgi:hypothetical protein